MRSVGAAMSRAPSTRFAKSSGDHDMSVTLLHFRERHKPSVAPPARLSPRALECDSAQDLVHAIIIGRERQPARFETAKGFIHVPLRAAGAETRGARDDDARQYRRHLREQRRRHALLFPGAGHVAAEEVGDRAADEPDAVTFFGLDDVNEYRVGHEAA